jgi:hypothetical protein
LPGTHEKNLIAQLAGCPGGEASIVLITMIRSTPAASIDSATVPMFAESSAEGSWLVDVIPRTASTAPAPENASVRVARSASDLTTATREPLGTSVMRSGRARTMAVNPIPSARHTPRMP